MPFVSQAQRAKFHAMAERGEISPKVVKEWEDATPKGAKLPKHVKKAYLVGVADALSDFGLKTAAEELRLKINKDKFHGLKAALRKTKVATDDGTPPLEPQGNPEDPVEQLTSILQAMPDPVRAHGDAQKDPLDRGVAWSGPSSLDGGDAGGRVSDLGQNTGVGAVI